MTLVRPEITSNTFHEWWRKISVAYVPGPTTPLLEQFAENFIDYLKTNGHSIHAEPAEKTDVILTTALFGEPVRWREAMLFTARRRFKLEHSPTIFTLVHATPENFHKTLDQFELALKKDPPDPEDFQLPGMAPEAYETLYEQGRRGGPMLSLLRMVQTQAMSIRIFLVVGDDNPLEAYTFDLVGAHPRTDAANKAFFYNDLVGRMVTALSTNEVTKHEIVGDLIPRAVWSSLRTPPAMRTGGRELGARKFFTEMVRVGTLAHVPSLPDAISSQYSEGCFASWDPKLGGLIATVTGSARPVVKDDLTDDELTVIVGVRPDGKGAQVRHVEGKRNDPPSSEAVELLEMDSGLPSVNISVSDGLDTASYQVPIARSKLHGHRGVFSYDPRWVEHVYLDKPYYHYPVSCSTEAQARAIKAAFSRSEALRNPDDPRQVVFTVLPGHGIVVVEKWISGKNPFQIMWEFMDSGTLQIENVVPQGPLMFTPGENGMMVLETID